MREFIPFLFLLPLVALAAWVSVWSRRQRRFYREHPQHRPYGVRLLIRASPFIAICVASGAYGLAAGNGAFAVLGVVGVLCFAWEIRQRWRPPS